MKINAIPDAVTRWIVGRASSFDAHGHPHWTYARIAENLKRSQFKLELNERQIRRVVERENPATYARRAAIRRRRTPAIIFA